MNRRQYLSGSALQSRVAQWQQRSLLKSVQSGVITLSNVNSGASAPLTAVVTANSICYALGMRTDLAGGAFAGGYATQVLTNTTTVTATRGAGAGTGDVAAASFMLIEFVPGVIKTIQRGTITIATGATSNTGAITAVNTAKSFLAPAGWLTDGDATAAIGQVTATLAFTNATTLTATRGSSSASFIVTCAYQAVEFY